MEIGAKWRLGRGGGAEGPRSLLSAYCVLLATRYLLFTACYKLPAACNLLPLSHYLLLVTDGVMEVGGLSCSTSKTFIRGTQTKSAWAGLGAVSSEVQ